MVAVWGVWVWGTSVFNQPATKPPPPHKIKYDDQWKQQIELNV